MQITKIIQTIAVLNTVLADNMKNICIQYLENIEILTNVKEQSFLNKENTYYIGLKQEQIKLYCQDLKLCKYSDNEFNDPIELYPLDNNSLLFEINETKIVQYYAFIFESQNIKFMVKSMQIEIVQENHLQRLLEETIPIESKLLFCEDSTCSITSSSKQIKLNEKIYLQQIVTDSHNTNYYLTNTTVILKLGEKQFRSGKVLKVDNSIKGQIALLLQVDIAWDNIEIQVYSNFSTTINGPSLSQTTLSTITTKFYPLISESGFDCFSNDCSVSLVFKMQLCSDKLCTNELDLQNIHYDDEIFVQQIVMTKGLQNYYITNTTVNLIGNGQFKQNFPLYIDNSQRGKAVALLKVDVEWQITNINMTSNLNPDDRGIQYTYSRISASNMKVIIMILLIPFY